MKEFATVIFLSNVTLRFSRLIWCIRSQANVSLARDHWRSLYVLSNEIKLLLLILREGKIFQPFKCATCLQLNAGHLTPQKKAILAPTYTLCYFLGSFVV